MTRLRIAITLLLAAAFGVVGLVLSGAGASAQSTPSTSTGRGIFTVRCDFSHRAPDDPIVAPGQPGASHEHDFFGNNSVTAHSTDESLRRAGTTCSRERDLAAYWAPTLSAEGRAVNPTSTLIYYRAGGKDPRTIRAHPAGLRVIAGDARATSRQSRTITDWTCGPRGRVVSTEVPVCPPGSHLVMRIRFPDCWNGQDLDSADHKAHMSYARRGRCRSSHPVPVPRLQMNIHYPTAGGPSVTLSSGTAYSAHADFWNTWDQQELERLVGACINSGVSLATPGCASSGILRPRITVGPKRARVGKATRFYFHVRAEVDGEVVPVPGASVRLAGRTARTNGNGLARVRARLRKRGSTQAQITFAGVRVARVTVHGFGGRR